MLHITLKYTDVIGRYIITDKHYSENIAIVTEHKQHTKEATQLHYSMMSRDKYLLRT